MTLPIGHRAMPASFRCAQAKGMPTMVTASTTAVTTCASADAATVAKPGYPECVAMLVQIGDHLSKQYDLG